MASINNSTADSTSQAISWMPCIKWVDEAVIEEIEDMKDVLRDLRVHIDKLEAERTTVAANSSFDGAVKVVGLLCVVVGAVAWYMSK